MFLALYLLRPSLQLAALHVQIAVILSLSVTSASVVISPADPEPPASLS